MFLVTLRYLSNFHFPPGASQGCPTASSLTFSMILVFETGTITVDNLNCHAAMSASFMENAVQFFTNVVFSPITMKTFNLIRLVGKGVAISEISFYREKAGLILILS